MKILHLDFSASSHLFQKACKSVGSDYVVIESGEELSDVLASERPDLILISLKLGTDLKDFSTSAIIPQIPKDADGSLMPIFLINGKDSLPNPLLLFHFGFMGAFSRDESPNAVIKKILQKLSSDPIPEDWSALKVALFGSCATERLLTASYLKRMGLFQIREFEEEGDLLRFDTQYDLFLLMDPQKITNFDSILIEIRKSFPEAVMIMISDIRREDWAVHVLTNGADDFIHKPFGFSLLKARLYPHLRNLRLISELKEKQRRILQVHRDLLTGIEIAKELQEGWIPFDFPNDDYIRAVGVYLPMDELGGDFYDYYCLDESHYYFLMTDVSGHGVSSALITSMIKLVFQNNAQTIDGPDLMMMTLNRGLYRTLGDRGYFVTSVCLYLDLEEKKLSLACAGHPDVLWQSGGEIRRLPDGRRDQILGLSAGVLYQSWDRSFQSGDRFLIYTDGVTEATNERDELFGEERLIRILQENFLTPVEELKKIILNSINDFRKNSLQGDDITFVIIEIP